MTVLRTGVVGTGALGRHHVRILGEMPEAELVGVFDERSDVAQALVEANGGRLMASVSELFGAVDAVVIATPTVSHCDLGVEALEAGCHVMVEKPMATTLEQADDLVRAAAAAEKILAVGHVEFYNPAVQRLLTMPGSPRFLEIQRLSSFSPRSLDIDVILDLMIHDLQIVQALCGPNPIDLRAVGIDVLSPRIDLADVRMEFEPKGDEASGCVASIRASRVSDQRVRQLRLFSDRYYCSLDYQEQTIKGYELREGELDDAAKIDGSAPTQGHGLKQIVPIRMPVESAEPLRQELEHFLSACRGEDPKLVDGAAGRDALRLALEIADLVA